jgi:hypothetical protein
MRYCVAGSAEVFQGPEDGERSGWARVLRYSWLAIAVLFLYVAGVMLLRWHQNREIEQQNERKAAAEQREEDRRTVEAMGGNRFEILAFYASPPQVHRGERVQLCYGVANTTTVKIEPGVEAMRPSYSRCVNVFPRKDTIYTLTAGDAAGHTITATVAVRVR